MNKFSIEYEWEELEHPVAMDELNRLSALVRLRVNSGDTWLPSGMFVMLQNGEIFQVGDVNGACGACGCCCENSIVTHIAIPSIGPGRPG